MNAEEYIAREEQKVIENLWSARNALTVDDMEFLAELKVEYGDCCGLESNCSPAIRVERPGNPCIGCGKMSSHYTLYVCDNQCRYMECDPYIFPGDRAFLQSCGIAVEPTRGTVYIEIVMKGESVRKRRKYLASRRRRGDVTRECGHYDLGEFAI
jgi:hypothetical protein